MLEGGREGGREGGGERERVMLVATRKCDSYPTGFGNN